MNDLAKSASERLQGPAIALAIFGFGMAAMNLAGVVFAVAGAGLQPWLMERLGEGEVVLPSWTASYLNTAFSVASSVLGAAYGGVIGYAGLRMAKLQSYTLCQVGAALALVPCCTGCCCFIGMPLGIWALLALNRPDVRAAFESNAVA